MNKNIMYRAVFSVLIFTIVITAFASVHAKSGAIIKDYYLHKVTFTGTGTYSYEYADSVPCDRCKNKHRIKMNMNFSWKVIYAMVLFSESNIAAQKNNQEKTPLCMAQYPSDIVCSFNYEEGFCETNGAGDSVYVNHKVPNGQGTDNGLAVYVYAEKSKTAGYYDFQVGAVNGFILQGDFQPNDQCSCPLKGTKYDKTLESFISAPKEDFIAAFSLSLAELKSGKTIKKSVACTIPHPLTGYDPDPSLLANDLAWTGTVTFEPSVIPVSRPTPK